MLATARNPRGNRRADQDEQGRSTEGDEGRGSSAYVQVAALVVGHVCGLTLAHDRALAVYRSAAEAVRSQYWMLAVMVAFTCLGLWLLSAVNT